MCIYQQSLIAAIDHRRAALVSECRHSAPAFGFAPASPLEFGPAPAAIAAVALLPTDSAEPEYKSQSGGRYRVNSSRGCGELTSHTVT